MNRRRLMQGVAVAAAVGVAERVPGAVSAPVSPRVIDAHIHLFNPARPGGVPWPAPGDLIYRTTLPEQFVTVAGRFGVVGAIAIEASPLAGDNDWLLQVVEHNPVMVGMVGDLAPGSPGFREQLDRLGRSPLYLGIRYGNLWDRNLAVDRKRVGFMEDLQYLARAGLVLETANPDLELVQAVLAIAEKIPELTIVVDHLPNARMPADGAAQREFFDGVASLGAAPKVYCKLSEVLENPVNGVRVPAELSTKKLDRLWQAFGPDKVMYGSDWPNSDHVATYEETISVVWAFLQTKGADGASKFFFANSKRAYRWKPRQGEQQAVRVPRAS